MKRRRSLLIFVFAVACSRGFESPTSPPSGTQPPATGTSGSVAGFVLDASNQCIGGARVEVVDGPRAGSAIVQTACAFWDYTEGEGNGYVFHNLPLGTKTTIRATAPGYKPAELQVSAGSSYSYNTNIVLTKE
jgi:hypothetical protein